MLDLGFATLYETRHPPGRRMPRHEHPFTKVSLVLAGALREWTAVGEHDSGAWQVVVKPAGIAHSDEIGPAGARIFTVQFAADFVAELTDAGERLATYRWVFGPDTTRAALAAFRLFRQPRGEPLDEAPLLMMLTALHGEGHGTAARGAPPSWLAAARDLLHAEFGRPLTVREVAHRVGVHAVHLTRVFRRHHGCTVGSYLRRLRLQAAATAIADGTALARAAAEAGFADQPHLTRAFRAAGGVTPRGYRRLLG